MTDKLTPTTYVPDPGAGTFARMLREAVEAEALDDVREVLGDPTFPGRPE